MLPLINSEGLSYSQTLPLKLPKDENQSSHFAENTPTSTDQVQAAGVKPGTSKIADSTLALRVRKDLDDIEVEQDLTLIWALNKIALGEDPLNVVQACKFNPSTPKGKKALMQLALAYARKNMSHFSEIIDQFGIEKTVLMEMAESAAVKGDAFSKNIKYGLDQDTLIALATSSAKEHTHVGISQCIQNYGIDESNPKGQRALIEIAKLAAGQYQSDIAQYIQSFGIEGTTPEGQEALFEIAKISCQKYQTRTPAYIQNFGFDKSTPEGQKKLIFLAKLCASQEEDRISPYIQNFGIDANSSEGKKALLQIARACTNRRFYCIISQHIKNFGFDSKTPEGQKALIEIAKLAALKDGVGTSRYIKNYGIDPTTSAGKKALICIAKIAAQKNGSMSQYIQNYGLETFGPEGQKALQDIAKMSAQSNGEGTSQFIANYGFDPTTHDGKKILWEIAEMAIQQNAEGASKYIHHYGFEKKTQEGQRALCRLATRAAELCPGAISAKGLTESIQNYGIDPKQPESQKALINIAYASLEHDIWTLAESIQNFRIDGSRPEGKKALRELAEVVKKYSNRWNNKLYAETSQNFSPDKNTAKEFKAKVEPSQTAKVEVPQSSAGKNQNTGFDPANVQSLQDFVNKAKRTPLRTSKFNKSKSSLSSQTEPMQNFNNEQIARLAESVWRSPTSCEEHGIDKTTREGQEVLIKIAKAAADKHPDYFIPLVKNYGIDPNTPEGQTALIDIAMILAKKSGGGGRLSEHIDNFSINSTTPEGRKALTEIAKTAVKNHSGYESVGYIHNYKIDATSPEGKAAWLEIAKLAAKTYDFLTIFINFPIDASTEEGQLQLIEINKVLLEKNWGVINPQFGMDINSAVGYRGLLEVVKLAVVKHASEVVCALPLFGLETAKDGPANLAELAMLAAKHNGEIVSKYIQNFGIDKATPQGQKLLGEIAKIAASKDGLGTSKYIQNYGIDKNTPEGRKTLIEIAKLAMHKSKEAPKYIKNYGLDETLPENQDALIEIAQVAAEKHGIIEYIEGFGIDFANRKDVLAEIAIKSAKADPEKTSKYIQRFPLDPGREEDRSLLIEIAKAAAISRGGYVSEYIQNYQIEASTAQGQKALIEIAELAAESNPYQTSKDIKNYGIDISTPEGRQGIIRIARIANANNHTYIGPCEFIQNYGLDKFGPEGFQVLVELAKANADHVEGSLIHKWIKNFGLHNYGLEGQKALIEVASLASQKLEGWKIGEHIENFAIDKTTPLGLAGLLEIAKNIAKQSGQKISRQISKFVINAASPQGQADLIEIAKLAAAQDGASTSELIANYRINITSDLGQAALIAIAKLAAEQNGWGLAQHIKKYSIDGSHPAGQKALIEIAKIAAHHGNISQYIQNFGIDTKTKEGRLALMEIAKIAASQNGYDILEYIANYGIDADTPEGQQALFEVAQQAIEQTPWWYSKLSKYKLNTSTEAGQKYALDLFKRAIIYSLMKGSWGSGNIRSLIKEFNPESLPLKDETVYSLSLGQPFLELSKVKIDEYITNIDRALALCESLFGLKASEVEWVKKTLDKKKDEPMIQREFITWFIATAAVCCSQKDLSALFKEQMTLGLISKLHPKLREAVIKQFIFMSFSQREPIWRKFREASDKIPHAELACLLFSLFPQEDPEIYFKAIACLKKEREFKDGNHQKLLLETLLKIKDCGLPPKQKATVIAMLFGLSVKRRLQAFRQVQDVLNFKGEAFLENISTPDEISQALENLFRTRIDIKVDQFAEKYEKTLGSWRQAEAIMTYAAKLQELPQYERTKALQLFKEFLTQVLEGSYSQGRYALEKNPHLTEIADKHPLVYAQWQQPIEMEATELNHLLKKKDEEPVTQKIVKNLKEALAHNHLAGDVQAIRFPELTGYVLSGISLEAALSQVEDKLKPLSRRLNEEEKDLKNRLLIEKKLLKLLSNSHEMEKKLMDVKSHIPKEIEFFNDIEGALRLLKKTEQQDHNKFTVIDTDDANHILLMGSEVEGSCQRVDGTANLNKCLLGFLLDGKHRLGVVCDSQGKIVARAVFRLLIDSTGQPVLFQEKVYVKDHGADYALLLRKLAAKKAKHLGLPLVFTKEEGGSADSGVDYPHRVHAKEKPIPFEYVDADRMGIQPGAYSIGNVAQLKV